MSRSTPASGRRFRPVLTAMEGRDVPAFLSGAEIAVGSDAGAPPLVRLIDPATQIEQASFLAFEQNFYGGVRVAVGDVTGDGYPDLICAAGPGGGPAVKIYNGQTGATSSFYAYAPSFTGGVNVATGDVNGDGVDEIIAGAGAAGGPQVTVYTAAGTNLYSFFAYQQDVRSGVRVAAGDVTGDGKAEVVTAPGYGGGPDVRVFDLSTGGSIRPRTGFYAYGASFTGGVYVATGDVDGDGLAEIVTGAGPGGGPQVSVFEGTGQQVVSYYAYAPDFIGGVRVGTAQLTNDKKAEVLTVAGFGGASQVNVYEVPNTGSVASMYAFPTDQTTGFFVAGTPERLNIASTPPSVIEASYAALKPAEQATQPLAPAPVVVNNYYANSYPWWWYGYGGFGGWYGGWYGASYFDGVGLYAPLNSFYTPTFFDDAGYYDPGYSVDPGIDPGFSDSIDTGFSDPGYYDPSGYPLDFGYYDPSFFDGGGFTDSGYFGSDFGGGFFDGGGFDGFDF